MADDLWHVEVYYRGAVKPAHRFTAVSTQAALQAMEDGLADETVGGVVAWRPPLQTGYSYEPKG